jgi:hypothetical protein
VKNYQIYLKTALFLSMTEEKRPTEICVEMADTGAVEEEGGNAATPTTPLATPQRPPLHSPSSCASRSEA